MISRKWSFRVARENAAELVLVPDEPHTARIAIKQAGTLISFDIQLNLTHFQVRAAHRYRVHFRGRADRPRSIKVGFAQAHEPWAGLGWYKEVALTTGWQSFEERFVVTQDEDNARIHFDAGESDIPVELSSVSLQSESAPPLQSSIFCFQARTEMNAGVAPLSNLWGMDRGLPLHRYYLEEFLAEFSSDIRGACLEFESAVYATRFGGSHLAKIDILHIDHSNPDATLVGDLTRQNSLPTDAFDCIVCTHVLQLIFEVNKAVSEIYRMLKPGGVLLVAEPHVSMCGSEYNEIWRFTPEGLERLLAQAFGRGNVTVRPYGNSLTAAGEIRGLVSHEFTASELNHRDARFPVEVCARAVKPSTNDSAVTGFVA